MFAVYGIYNGKSVKIKKKLPLDKKYKVIVTFIEEISDNEKEYRDFSSQTSAMEFWNNSAEDLYQEYLPK